ncbi:MAG: tetratricopeptide repeat protein [Armatimonadetes bacterium]|nr:MAG: tetratricopeptide repeat protein [Armatimonadota bacterium]
MFKDKFVLALVIVGFAVYLTSILNGFVWDDFLQITDNPKTTSLSSLNTFFTEKTGYYYKPVMMSVFTLIYSIFKDNPFPYHLLQVLLYIANAVLLYKLFNFFFTRFISFSLAAIFLVHPINYEAAGYVAAMQDTLYMFWGLLAVYLIRRDLKKKEVITSGWLIFVMIFLSLLSKESGLLFVFATLLLTWSFAKKEIKKTFIYSGSAFIIYSILRFLIAGVGFVKNELVPIQDISLTERLISIPQILFYYLKTFFYPKNLAIDQNWVVKELTWVSFYLPLIWVSLAVLILIIGYIFIYRKRRTFAANYSFFLIWCIIGLLPYLQLVPLDMTVADRWFYFSAIGLLGIIGVFLSQFSLNSKKIISVIGLIMTGIVITLSIRTIIRAEDWKDSYTLYTHDLALSRESYTINNNLGVELFKNNEKEEAAKRFKRALEIMPKSWDAWNNLGVAYLDKGDFKEAKNAFEKAVEIDPTFYAANTNLARVLLFYNSALSAKEFIEKALEIFPQDPVLLEILSMAEYRLGNFFRAIELAEQANLSAPNDLNEYLLAQLRNSQKVDVEWVIRYYQSHL